MTRSKDAARHVRCESCNCNGAKLCERVHPRNWHLTRKRLCGNCRDKEGFRLVSFGRSNVNMARSE
jgi:hypothetical protein